MSIETAKNKTLLAQQRMSAEEFITASTELSSSILLLYDVQNDVLQYNDHQLCAELGYESDPLLLDLNKLIHPDDLEKFFQTISQLKSGEVDRKEFTLRFRTEDGIEAPYAVKGRRQERNGYLMFVATKTNALLHGTDEVEDLLRMKAEAESILQFGTFEYDRVNDFGKWSDGLYKMFGYGDERPVINMAMFLRHLDAAQREALAQQIQETMDVGKEYTTEYSITTCDGVAKRVQVIARRIYNSDQQAVRTIGIVRDLTHIRLQEERLQKAVEELKRSNKELEEFAYVASHDLQEPLRKISTFGGRLADKYGSELKEDGRLYLERIIASSDNMRKLIDNLLEFSRISRVSEPFVSLNLDFVLHQVKSELELSMEETGTSIKADPLPTVEASLMQMRQLFGNIINNAIKFRKPGQRPEIEIMAHRLSATEKSQCSLPSDKEYFSISFCDNGIGFENEYATRIFQIFQRLHGKSDYPGSGIGLAICKKISDHHNGLISATNRESGGACFTIILPEKQS